MELKFVIDNEKKVSHKNFGVLETDLVETVEKVLVQNDIQINEIDRIVFLGERASIEDALYVDTFVIHYNADPFDYVVLGEMKPIILVNVYWSTKKDNSYPSVNVAWFYGKGTLERYKENINRIQNERSK